MFTVQFYLLFVAFLTAGQALDYIFLVPEEGAIACDDSEDLFLDKFFDTSNIEWTPIDDETINLNGYATFLQEINSSLHLHIEFERYNSGRWIETPYQLDRVDICPTMYSENEMWYEYIRDFDNSSKVCPPQIGMRYDFHDIKISTLFTDLPLGLDGTYRALLKLFVAEKAIFCVNIEGDLQKKSKDDKMFGAQEDKFIEDDFSLTAMP